jgi:hypothetical protein
MATTCETIFILPSGDAGIDDPRASRRGCAARDRELAADDDRHHPGRRQVQLDERDERGRDQQLVGERIEHLAER